MKSILLAAAALIAAPAIAQEAPAPAEPAMQAPPAPGGDPSSTMPAPAPAAPAATTAASGDPVGGYQPSAPPMQGTPAPGSTVVFKQAPDPSTAYPAPAPLQKYPVCKKGQYDKCMNPGGK